MISHHCLSKGRTREVNLSFGERREEDRKEDKKEKKRETNPQRNSRRKWRGKAKDKSKEEKEARNGGGGEERIFREWMMERERKRVEISSLYQPILPIGNKRKFGETRD